MRLYKYYFDQSKTTRFIFSALIDFASSANNKNMVFRRLQIRMHF